MVKLIACVLIVVPLALGCANTANHGAPPDRAEAEPGNKPGPEPDFEFHNISGGSLKQTEEILHNSLVGHVIVNGEYPHSTPVNYIYENRVIYFPLRKNADKQFCDIIKKDYRVCFAVDQYNGDRWHSIHIFGKAEVFDRSGESFNWLNKYQETFGEAGFTYDKDANNLLFVRLTPELVTVRLNYGIPYWYLGKLKPTPDGKLEPVMQIPTQGGQETTTFTGNVEFIGLPATVADTVLRSSHSGRINTLGDDYPYSVPLNCSFPKGKIYIHSKKNGLKVLNIAKKSNVSFDVEWLWNGQEWLTVTVEGMARLLSPDEGIEAMQHFSKFLESPDGLIPVDFKPQPGKQMGSERMTQRMAVLEITPERVITRSVPIAKKWWSKMPSEVIAP